jgi:hypothetical protein
MMDIQRWAERLEDELHADAKAGRINRAELDRELGDLRKEYREAVNDRLGRWRRDALNPQTAK